MHNAFIRGRELGFSIHKIPVRADSLVLIQPFPQMYKILSESHPCMRNRNDSTSMGGVAQ